MGYTPYELQVAQNSANVNIPEYSLTDQDIAKRRGPLAKLDKNPYMVKESLKYPKSNDTARYPHYIRFNINLPGKSSYDKVLEKSPDGGTSVVDETRAGLSTYRIEEGYAPVDMSTLGYNEDAITAGAAAVASTEAGVFVAAKMAADAAANPSSVAKFGGARNAVRAAVGVGIAAGIGTDVVLTSIDVTRKTKRLLQSIELYIPDQVVMTSENRYNELKVTDALGAAGLFAQGAMAAGGSMQTAAENNLERRYGAGESPRRTDQEGSPFMTEAAAALAGAAGKKSGLFGEGIEELILQSYGYAQNPQIEILFDSVQNRSFRFQFNFHPKDKDEAEEVLKIIRAFRFHSAPEIAQQSSGRYFIPPSEFDITYMFNGEENKALHRFSTCVLTSVDVNYVGDSGQFTTFSDGIPVNIQMILDFKEVEIIHKALVDSGF